MTEGHGGELIVATLAGWGVGEIFTLSGGHIFPLYDGCVQAGIRLVDVRHEQTAGFAAEAWAKVTRPLFFDLVDLGEAREISGTALFGVLSMGAFFPMAPADQVKGFA